MADFSWVIAGPYGTYHLAQLGAEVIKIEGVQRLDNNRDHVPFADGVPGLNRSGQFALLNAGKKSVTLELHRTEDRAMAEALIAQSDVVVENFRCGVMEDFGLGYQAVRRIRPDIIMVSCSGFGQTGPMRGFSAFMSTVHGFAGLIGLNGFADQPPNPLGGNWADYGAGTAIPLAVMAALHYRERTGKGQHIDLSMAEAMMSLMGVPFMEYFMNRRNPHRLGHRSPTAIQGVYSCGDGRWIAISLATNQEWRGLVRAMGKPVWSREPDFDTMAGSAAVLQGR